jgi:hypothetical protein
VPRRAAITGVLLASALLAAAPAAGAAPITFGKGRFPDVAVDENNTAHVVWDSIDGAGPDRLFYCQIPRTASSCQNTKALTPPLRAIGRSSYVFAPGGGRVLIVSFRCCDTSAGEGRQLYESTDGGLTFGAPTRIGSQDPESNAVLGPGDSISGSAVSDFQNSPLSGFTNDIATLDSGFPVPTHGAVAVHNGTTPVLVQADGSNTSFDVYKGTGPLNDKASWTGPTALPAGDEPSLAGGPAGTTLLLKQGTPGKTFWSARRFDGSGFGPAVHVTETGDPIEASLGTTPFGGAFHAVWVDNRSPNELRWARSADGLSWSDPYTSFSGDEADNAFHLRVSGASDGRAFAVWDQNDNAGSAKGVLLPAPGKDEPAVDSADAGQLEVGLIVPFACVAKPAKARLQVTSKTKKKIAKNKRVRITKVVFTLDGLPKVTDKKAAFRNDFSTASLAAPSSNPASAAVTFVPVKGGKAKTKKLKGTVRICS